MLKTSFCCKIHNAFKTWSLSISLSGHGMFNFETGVLFFHFRVEEKDEREEKKEKKENKEKKEKKNTKYGKKYFMISPD